MLAGTTGLEPAASAVTGLFSLGGYSGFNGLRVFSVVLSGYTGQQWKGFVQRIVQRKREPLIALYRSDYSLNQAAFNSKAFYFQTLASSVARRLHNSRSHRTLTETAITKTIQMPDV
jgi:hypothetical protein